MKRCFSSCCGGDDDDTPLPSPPRSNELTPVSVANKPSASGKLTSAVAVAPRAPAGTSTNGEKAVRHFIRLAADNPWLVCRSPEHGGKLFWMNEHTQESTWRQPLPRAVPLPEWDGMHPSMRAMALMVSDAVFFGAPASLTEPKARTGICGIAPNQRPLRTTCESLSAEHCLYPR